MTNFALLQTNIAFCDPEANFKRVRELFAQAMAKDPRPDVVVLPEDWSAGFSDEMFHHMEDFVEPENGPSVTVLRELAQAVDREVVRQTGYLERSEIMEESLRDFGCAIVCDSLERCVELANEIAPEHLEIMTEEPRALLPLVKNAGAVFLGAYAPEPLGDYLAGPDHTLPTSGTARFFSPLSVDSFLKTMSVLEFDRAALAPIAGEIITLAETEHLTAHANSIRVRMDG